MPPLDAPVFADREMWEKVVLNLLANAFKFTLAGSITVALHRVREVAELVIRDTGVGIPADELPRIFERFHRVEGQGGRTHEGSGIGLVDELIRLHGGTIKAESTPGQGTTIRASIPFGTAHLPAASILAERTLPSTAVGANSYVEEALRWLPDENGGDPAEHASGAFLERAEGKPRIVLADDNADMRAYVAGILTRSGYAMEAVDDGAGALAAARREPPDLVLTDVMMPELDGCGLLRELRSSPSLEGLLVILLSAGADDYLVKPFSARELRARVDGAIRLARQRREAVARERDLRAEISTERSRAALRETERRLAFALEAGRLGSWNLDLTTGCLIASDLCRANLGFQPGEVLESYGQLLDRIHPDDRARQQRAARAAIESRSLLDDESRIWRPDGEVSWIEIRGQAIYGTNGTAVGMSGVSLDVTARKRNEEQQKLLLDELNHRVKNTLASVQSSGMQTRRSARTPDAFIDDLNTRIKALARP